ncbi:MAG TPA: His/Gly/Thr/Pro-type tRNA ligase C-terminal domain-containing protein [Candidatus Babeliaceae bacterium]|nr:His/Gly/Thr/Pro-type tRNA ligase C-terminal domain-containing protein [Candidatus Babeliaceae bacterium]
MISNLPQQVSCSMVLAAALGELFPDAKVLSMQATEKCFFCDIAFPFTFEDEMLPLLEERMRRWIKKNLPFQQLEMLPSNAVKFFEHHGNSHAAFFAQRETGLVRILQLDRFVGKSPGKSLASTGLVKFFKLVQAEVYGSWIRILGVSASSKQDLKSPRLPSSHLKLVQELSLLTPSLDGWIWLPRGEILKKVLIERVCQDFSGIDPISTSALSDKELVLCHARYLEKTKRGSIEFLKRPLDGEGRELLDPAVGTVDRLFLPFQEESIISFLQIITKFLKIFAFEHEEVNPVKRGLKKPHEIELIDALGRSWKGPSLWLEEKTKMVGLSLFHSLERFIALLVEKTEGRLPFWLQPEQVRILSMQDGYAREVKQALERAGFRVGLDVEKSTLAGRMRRSLQERVPFSIVIGDREKMTGQLTVRTQESPESLTMDLETLMNRLKQFES